MYQTFLGVENSFAIINGYILISIYFHSLLSEKKWENLNSMMFVCAFNCKYDDVSSWTILLPSSVVQLHV